MPPGGTSGSIHAILAMAESRAFCTALIAGGIDATLGGGGFRDAIQFGSLAALSSSVGDAGANALGSFSSLQTYFPSGFDAVDFFGSASVMLILAYILGQRDGPLLTSAAIVGVSGALSGKLSMFISSRA
jgi:hypothetical protein